MSNSKFHVRARDEHSSMWKLTLPAIQGAFDLEVEGYFRHYPEDRRASEWELFEFHKCNGMEATAENIEKLIGHGCRDQATEILDGILSPIMDADRIEWLVEMENQARDDAMEMALHRAHYQRQQGF